MNNKIGVLGGMGSMASEIFYKMTIEMTDAQKDQDYMDMIIYSDAGMPDRTKAILEKNYAEVKDRILKDLTMLSSCGCKAVGITCNTAHFFVDLLDGELPVEVVHMVRETTKAISEKLPGSRVAILATDGTIKTGLYENYLKDAGLEPYIPSPEVQEKVMYEIYDCIKAGKAGDMETWEEIEKSIKQAGCESAILGCTELSVIKSQNQLSDYYVDPMRILAEKLITISGKKLKLNMTIYKFQKVKY